MEILKNGGHGFLAHGLRPYVSDDLVENFGSGCEEFGHDSLVVGEDGASFVVLFFVFEEGSACGYLSFEVDTPFVVFE